MLTSAPDSYSEDSLDGLMQLRSKKVTFLLSRSGKERRETRIGHEFQASIPPCRGQITSKCMDTPLWVPNRSKLCSDSYIKQYLQKASKQLDTFCYISQPQGDQCRDHELGLYYLYNAKFDANLALRNMTSNNHNISTAFNIFRYPQPWNLEDCELFERGLRQYCKNFLEIQKEYLPHKSIQDLVEFYYFWKKSERYDCFIQNNRKRKINNLIQTNEEKVLDENFSDRQFINESSMTELSSDIQN